MFKGEIPKRYDKKTRKKVRALLRAHTHLNSDDMAALLSEQGFLTPNGKPYTAATVRNQRHICGLKRTKKNDAPPLKKKTEAPSPSGSVEISDVVAILESKSLSIAAKKKLGTFLLGGIK